MTIGTIDVRIAISRRGTTSVTYAFEFVRADVVHARGERTMVFVDRQGSLTRIPDGGTERVRERYAHGCRYRQVTVPDSEVSATTTSPSMRISHPTRCLLPS